VAYLGGIGELKKRKPRAFWIVPLLEFWRGVRVAYGGGLENRCSRKGTVGSNPTPSAIFLDIFSHPAALAASRAYPLIYIYRPQTGRLRGAKPLSKIFSPSPFKERGIKGVRSIKNIF
jgi:hypothetical protein